MLSAKLQSSLIDSFSLHRCCYSWFFDAIAGGGGLIQLPALLVGMQDKPVVNVLGTNKFAGNIR
jgi:uncharacterized membrane protein YfcA